MNGRCGSGGNYEIVKNKRRIDPKFVVAISMFQRKIWLQASASGHGHRRSGAKSAGPSVNSTAAPTDPATGSSDFCTAATASSNGKAGADANRI